MRFDLLNLLRAVRRMYQILYLVCLAVVLYMCFMPGLAILVLIVYGIPETLLLLALNLAFGWSIRRLSGSDH